MDSVSYCICVIFLNLGKCFLDLVEDLFYSFFFNFFPLLNPFYLQGFHLSFPIVLLSFAIPSSFYFIYSFTLHSFQNFYFFAFKFLIHYTAVCLLNFIWVFIAILIKFELLVSFLKFFDEI